MEVHAVLLADNSGLRDAAETLCLIGLGKLNHGETVIETVVPRFDGLVAITKCSLCAVLESRPTARVQAKSLNYMLN
jgi:hypothetical protein